MNVIDAVDIFSQLQQESKADRELIQYCRDMYDIELPFPLPETPYIIISDKMYAWIPERED